MAILREFSPLVEPVSVDEAYLDMTGMERMYGPPAESAKSIKRRVRDELALIASIGVGHNRLVAKVASDESKPDGLMIIQPEEAARFFAPLPIRKLPGIGPKAADRLHALRIETLGQLAATPTGVLRRAVGERMAAHLKRRASRRRRRSTRRSTGRQVHKRGNHFRLRRFGPGETRLGHSTDFPKRSEDGCETPNARHG